MVFENKLLDPPSNGQRLHGALPVVAMVIGGLALAIGLHTTATAAVIVALAHVIGAALFLAFRTTRRRRANR